MPRKTLVASAVLSFAVALLASASPASAHKMSLKLGIGPLVGSTSPVQIQKAGVLSITGFAGGTVVLALKDMRDQNGVKMNVFGNELRMELRVNGVPTSVAYPFDIKNGKGTMRSVLTPAQDLFKGDLVELIDVDLVDPNGVQFGVLGVPAGTRIPIYKSALVYVIDSLSPIHFSRGGDSRLKLRDNGNLNTGFDGLRDDQGDRITSPQVKVEIVIVRNGGAPELHFYQYDIVRGRSVPNGRPHVDLGLDVNETVEVRRLDVLDNAGNRFATMGLKILAPRDPAP